MLPIVGATENLWQQLMESGIFDDNYPQRVNACFHYLSNNSQVFTLKDLIQKSAYTFTYLSIDVEKDSNFATMDVFRTFDRSGSNNVTLEDFVLGIIERLHLLRKDTNTLEIIADLLISVESRVIELSALLEKGNNKNSKFSKYNNNLGALSYDIRHEIKLIKSQQGITVLTKELLVKIFERCIAQGVSVLVSYFHLSPPRLATLLVHSPEDPAASSVSTMPVIWTYKEQIKAAFLTASSSPPSHPSQATGAAGAGGMRRQSRHEDGAEDIIAQFLSNMDESKLNLPNRGSNPPSSHAHPHSSLASNLTSLLPPAVLANMDSNKLYLLQQAYEGLNLFFTLVSQIAGGGEEGTNPTLNAPVMNIHNHYHVHNTQNNTMNINIDANSAPNPPAAEASVGSGGDMGVVYEDYFQQQHKLKSLNSKLEILELIQSDHLYHIQHMEAEGAAGGAMASSPFVFDSPSPSPLPVDHCPSYGDILEEIQLLGVKMSERTQKTFPLGALYENPYMNVLRNDNNNIFLSLYNLEQMCLEVLENVYACSDKVYNIYKLAHDVYSKDQQVRELLHKQEVFNFERNDLITTSLEIQVLKDKLNKYVKDENLYKMIEVKNLELNKKIKELEEQITTLQNEKKMPTNSLQQASGSNAGNNAAGANRNPNIPAPLSLNNSSQGTSHSQSNSGGSSSSDGALLQVTADFLDSSYVTNNILSSSLSETEKIKKLVEYSTSLTMHMTHLSKENNKYQANLLFYEKRIKNSINDQMMLHNNIHALEDEISMYKSNITKLTREIEDHKIYKYYKEEYDKQIYSYQTQISQYKNEILEAQNNLLLANKYHNDLIQAERTIESMEHKISEFNIELEKGNIAIAQLENLREQLKVKTKEMRDMSLHIHGLENQLRELPYINARCQEVMSELQECKAKSEKIPGLLSEISRLRGSSRASIKALAEQDKMLSTYKGRVKALEKETALLKHDNRALQDVENKLKESNSEVKRLMTLLADKEKEGNGGAGGGMAGGSGGTGGVSPMNKKMQKYMRQSAFFPTNPMAPRGGAGPVTGGVAVGAPAGTAEGDDTTM